MVEIIQKVPALWLAVIVLAIIASVYYTVEHLIRSSERKAKYKYEAQGKKQD